MRKYLGLIIIFCLTLGLAPFVPHPHIWKQLQNIIHNRPMTGMDWLDLAMHGAPWVLLIVVLIAMAVKPKDV